MKLGAFARAAVRESRGERGRLAFLTGCLALGVAAVVAVAGLADAVESGVLRESRRLLAADLAIRGRAEPPPEVVTELDRPGVQTALVRELTTMAGLGVGPEGSVGTSRLVELKAVASGYPFYGELETDPAGIGVEQLGIDGALIAEDLVTQLGVKRGDEILLGGQPFRVLGTIRREPDRLSAGMALGPRILIGDAGLSRSGLLAFGSRVSHRLLVRVGPELGDAALRELAAELKSRLEIPGADVQGGSRYRVETHLDAQPALRDGIRQLERFLSLAALLSLLLGAIGAGQVARSWVEERRDSIAIRRAVGQRPREVLALYLLEAVLLGLAGGVVGAILGTLVQFVVPHFLPEALADAAAVTPQPAAIARGLALGLLAALAATVGPLIEAGRVPPLRALRGDVEPPEPSMGLRLSMAAGLVGALVLAARIQTSSWVVALAFTIGLLVLAGALWLAATAFSKLLAQLARLAASAPLRHGLRATARPGSRGATATVALGLGVVLTLGGGLVGDALGDALGSDVPADAPTAFLIDIQPDQNGAVEAVLREHGATSFVSVPVVMARIRAIDGQPATEIVPTLEKERRWALQREQRLTWGDLPADNEIVEGSLWNLDDVAEVSVEEEFARDLGVGIGQRLTFDIQGVPIDLTVTSLRTVNWRTFGINFFLVAEPGVLEGAPHTLLATTILPPDREAAIQDRLVAAHPNVTLVKIREVLEKITAALGRLEMGIRALTLLVVLAGAGVLAGAIASQSARRAVETALLKTLGMTRTQVAVRLATEAAAMGLVAGVIGVLGGNLLAWIALERAFELEWSLRPWAAVVTVAATTGLAMVTGTLAAGRALAARPLRTLR